MAMTPIHDERGKITHFVAIKQDVTERIQAQRDLFGAHTYERIDKPGSFHSHWGL